jgi:hypothetical protein
MHDILMSENKENANSIKNSEEKFVPEKLAAEQSNREPLTMRDLEILE